MAAAACDGGGVGGEGEARGAAALVGEEALLLGLAAFFLAAASWAVRQTCARRPSIWRRPFLILGPSKEARLSKETERRFSMLSCVVCVGYQLEADKEQ